MSAAAPDDQAIQVAWNGLRLALREIYAIDRAFALAYLSSASNALRNVAHAKSRTGAVGREPYRGDAA